MTEAEERAYELGLLDARRRTLSHVLQDLGPSVDGDAARWMSERLAVVSLLRTICAEHGDNDWPDTLHLCDVIEKHLWRHIEDSIVHQP